MEKPSRHLDSALDLAEACFLLVRAIHDRSPTPTTEEALRHVSLTDEGRPTLWLPMGTVKRIATEHTEGR